ncbi:uromodulin-like 1 [Mixophyes fleayi]|uniref:uromodulin-like 1 n=1 Tax=Mixophyes fleayi TaxID=3061075 RepID=UPI003F4E168A
MDRIILMYIVTLCLASGLGSGQIFDNTISPSSYHVCSGTVTVNVSKIVAFQKPREDKTLCMGWIPWKLCTRTYYQTEYRTIYVPETTAVKQCCEGYELVGHYCAMTTERSSTLSSRPGICPNIIERNPDSRCTFDYDCPGFQKCCMSSNGSFCGSPGPQALGRNTTYWYNGTVTIKMSFDELIRLDVGLVNHTRLLHSVVTGELWPLEAAVYHISTKPAGTFSVLSHILIGLNESHSLPDITTMLNNIVTSLPEVINIQIDDVNSCLFPEPGACPPRQRCIIMESSYNCSNKHKPNSTHIPPDNTSNPNLPHSPDFTRPFTANATNAMIGTTTPPPCYCSTFLNHSVSNVTASAFQIHWNTDCPENYLYNIEIWTSKGFHRKNTIAETSMNINGLNAGELYHVLVTFQDCAGQKQIWEERVKTEANVLNGTLRIQNWNLTESLLDPNSTDYTAFVEAFVSEVKKSLSNEIPPKRVTVEVQSLRPGSIIVNFQIIIDDSKDPINLTASSFSHFNQSGVFTVDLKSIIITDSNECLSSDDNDCHLHADCVNLDPSYTCKCHSAFVDTDPSRPGRNCEAMLSTALYSTNLDLSSPSVAPWTSTDPRSDVYSTSPIDKSSPTISSTTGHIANVTAATTETSTVLRDPTPPAKQVTPTALVSGEASKNQSGLNTPVTLKTGPANSDNTTAHDQLLSTTHKIMLNTTESTDHSTTANKDSSHTSSNALSVTEHGSIHSSTNNKGIIQVVVPTTHTASDISCPLADMSTNSNVEATNIPFLLAAATKMTTQQMSPSLSLRDASKVICETEKIGITIQKAFLKMMSIDSHSLFLGSPECSLNCSTNIFILIHAGWKECNTNVYSNKTHIVINSTLYIDLSSSILNMTPKPISTIRCVFHNDILWSSGSNPAGGFFTIVEKLEGGGSFLPEFQLFIGDQSIPANFTLSATDDIIVQIRIKTEESQYKVVINECWATPTDNANDPVSFPFINNSCALTNTFTTIQTNGISNNATFQTKIFSFVNNPIVYLHCRLHVCKEDPPATCKPSCSGVRSVRSGENVFIGVTRMGPLRRAGQSHVTASSSEAALGPGYIALIIIGVFVLVAIVVAGLIFWHQRRTGNYNFKLKSKDVGYQVFSN